MPSRKRDKGRARKEKKASAASKKNDDAQQQQQRHCRQQQGRQAPSQELQHLIGNLALEDESSCSHGFPPLPANDICHRFIREFEFALQRLVQLKLIYGSDLDSYSYVLRSLDMNDLKNLLTIEDCQEKLSASLVSMGTNYLLQDTTAGANVHVACVVAMFVLKIESGGVLDQNDPHLVSKVRDLWEDQEREATRFFVKKIKCSCLKGKYKQMKSEPKYGVCFHCAQGKERKELSQCTGCRVAQYCSEKCQRAHWPWHKGRCIGFKSKVRSDFLSP